MTPRRARGWTHTSLVWAMLLVFLASATAGPAAGAWDQFRGNAQKTGFVDDGTAPRSVGWIFESESGSQLVASPVTDGVTVVVADYQGQVSGIDVFDGSLLWTRRTPDFVTATPAIAGDVVLVPSGKSLLAYEVHPSGTSVSLRWSFNANARIDSPPTVEGGAAYFGSDDRTLYKVDIATGALAWSFTTEDVVKSSPAVSGGRVFMGSYDGKVYALDDKGSNVSLAWSFNAGGEVAGSPAVDGGTVYVCTLGGRVFAIDGPTGDKEWEASPGGVIVASPAVVDGLLIIGGDTLAALDLANGVTVWDRPLGGYVRSSPAAAGGLVFAGDYAGRFFAFGLDGSLSWSYDTGSAIRTSPAVGGGLALVGNDDGRLFGLPLDAGAAPDVMELPARQTFEGVRETFAAVAFDPEGRDLVYTWSFGDGSTQEGRVAHHAFGSPGNYTVEVTVSDGQQASTVTGIVTVLPFSGTVTGGQSDGGSTGTDNTMLYAGAAVAVAAALGLVVFFAVRRRRSAPDGRVAPAPESEPPATKPAERSPPPRAPQAPAASPPSQFDYYERAYGAEPPAKGPARRPPRPPDDPRGP